LEHVTLPCECIACSEGLFSPLGMPLSAYKEISALPLPIPQPPPATGLPGDLHYMTLDEAMKMPFTAEHQPSLEVRRARSQNTTAHDGVALAGRERSTVDATRAKTLVVNHVRGVVECKDCMKPRCLFSVVAPNRMKPASIDGREPSNDEIKACREYAAQQMEAAIENPLYICGMQPLEPDNLMHTIIIARDGLECHDHVEFDYYTHPYQNAEWFKAAMCAYCASSSGLDGFVDAPLREQWKSLLPVCQDCRDAGALPLARTRKRNSAARARQTETARLAEEARADRESSVERPEGTAPSPRAEATPRAPAAQRQVRRRNRRPPAPSAPIDPTNGVPATTPSPTPGILSASVESPDA
jgi:hypothetical protein